MIEYTHFIYFFIITLIIGALFIVGLYETSLGDTKKYLNGEYRYNGMIFYKLRLFLERKKEEKLYLKGWELNKFLQRIKIDFSQIPDVVNNFIDVGTGTISYYDIPKEEYNNIHKILDLICKKYKTEVDIFEKDKYFRIYQIYEKPIIPTWITKPLFLCYKCYASIYGSIIFYLSSKFAIKYYFIEEDWEVLRFMWVIYIFCLITVSMYIYKKTD